MLMDSIYSLLNKQNLTESDYEALYKYFAVSHDNDKERVRRSWRNLLNKRYESMQEFKTLLAKNKKPVQVEERISLF